MKKFTLYVGLNDAETKEQAFETEYALEVVKHLLIDEYDLQGATLQLADGIYKHRDGSIVTEKTVVIILLDIPDCTVNEIIDDLKIIFSQECVLKEVCFVDYSFM